MEGRHIIRHVDIPTSGPAINGLPGKHSVPLRGAERICSVETLKDSFGFGTVRVWIVKEP